MKKQGTADLPLLNTVVSLWSQSPKLKAFQVSISSGLTGTVITSQIAIQIAFKSPSIFLLTLVCLNWLTPSQTSDR